MSEVLNLIDPNIYGTQKMVGGGGSTPAIETYDKLAINYTTGNMYETGYIPNENTEVIVEFSNWDIHARLTSVKIYLFGVAYGTRAAFGANESVLNEYDLLSMEGGKFNFGGSTVKAGSGNAFIGNGNSFDTPVKIRLKLNKNGIYKYDYEQQEYNLLATFSSTPTWTAMQDSIVLFGLKKHIDILDIEKEYTEYFNMAGLTVNFYFMEVYENNVLKAKYVPAKQGDTIGVYDTVAQKMLDRVNAVSVSNE